MRGVLAGAHLLAGEVVALGVRLMFVKQAVATFVTVVVRLLARLVVARVVLVVVVRPVV
jgi:hypothetical protein